MCGLLRLSLRLRVNIMDRRWRIEDEYKVGVNSKYNFGQI
jgi:hypothetical protein